MTRQYMEQCKLRNPSPIIFQTLVHACGLVRKIILAGAFHVIRRTSSISYQADISGCRYGPSTLTPIGSLVGWTVIPRLPCIRAATLVFNGEHDTSGDICTAPFFEYIPHVRWLTFRNASHMCHMDEGGLREYVLKVVGDFLIEDNSISPP